MRGYGSAWENKCEQTASPADFLGEKRSFASLEKDRAKCSTTL